MKLKTQKQYRKIDEKNKTFFFEKIKKTDKSSKT